MLKLINTFDLLIAPNLCWYSFLFFFNFLIGNKKIRFVVLK